MNESYRGLNLWGNLGDVVVLVAFVGLSVLSIAPPGAFVDQIKRSNPHFAGDDKVLLLIVKIIGATLLVLSGSFSIPIFRAF
jgi:hypothetical protein